MGKISEIVITQNWVIIHKIKCVHVCMWERNFNLLLVSDSDSLSHPNASDMQQKTLNVNTYILISIHEDLNT